tara:strand:- start:728 stop:1018 length:291 start_codon:yes stop_codon:yes gene_type:complete
MSRHHMVNGIKVDFTDAEETARDAEEKTWNDAAPDRAFDELRNKRNMLLAQSDWRAAGDLTISDEWKAYRKKLRDLPGTLNDTTVLETITWPTEPS